MIRLFNYTRTTLNSSEYDTDLISTCSHKLDAVKSRKGLNDMDDFYVMQIAYFDWLFGSFIIITIICFIIMLVEIFAFLHFNRQIDTNIRLNRRYFRYYYVFEKENFRNKHKYQ